MTDAVANTSVRGVAGNPASSYLLAGLILLQALCVIFFASDAIADIWGSGRVAFANWHIVVETIASAALLVALVIQVRVLIFLVTRQRRLSRAVTAAAGGLHDLVEAYFADWSLTASEKDVAWLTLKGLSISEVAAIRGSAEGTVKAQLNAVYRKSGLAGRNALLALVVEDLLSGDLVQSTQTGAGNAQHSADGVTSR
ncbi:helix-turn-helix transcriptional regulator [Pseudooceanicola sp. MF1-13]|uniref:helix-turn-helix transcriptional regulator n=1 Tax=Pseudooceanicola sp. MF1-13 TaxID=3379095 RepID=UPI0038918A95